MGSSGSFIAILLSVPLTVVALVGVVGVPKLQEMFASASASHEEDDEFDRDGFSSRSRSKRATSKADREKGDDAELWGEEPGAADDLADDFGGKPKSTKPKITLARGNKSKPADEFGSDLAEKPEDDLFNNRRGRFGPTPKEPEAVETFAMEPFKSRSAVINADLKTPAPVRGGGSGSFPGAIERLRGMGVERYHLEPGLAAGQFLFVCQVEGNETAPTIHRFEAEANDPTIAVEDVLKQVASWQAETSVTRTAAAGTRR